MTARRPARPQTRGPSAIDVWRAVGAIIRRELPPDQEQVLAALLAGDAPGMTPETVIAGIRELHDAGYLAVGEDGRAYLTRPVRGPFGNLARVPMSGKSQ